MYGLIRCLPIFALISLALYLPLFFLRRHRGVALLRHIPAYLLVGYCVSLLYLTILWYWPDITFSPGWHFLNLRPFIWLTQVYDMGVARMTEQILLNMAMFVPLGFLLPMNFFGLRAFWKTAAMSLAVTLTIETLQYFMGRSADIDDVIMNLLGGMLGYALYLLLNCCLKKCAWWKRLTGEPRTL